VSQRWECWRWFRKHQCPCWLVLGCGGQAAVRCQNSTAGNIKQLQSGTDGMYGVPGVCEVWNSAGKLTGSCPSSYTHGTATVRKLVLLAFQR